MSNGAIRVLVGVAAVAAGAFLCVPARAGDAPTAPKPIPKVQNAFLDGLVGSWDLTTKGMGGEGVGAARFRKAAGGTTLVQEARVASAGHAFRVTYVVRVEEGGKAVRLWRFDTISPTSLTPLKGTLADDGLEAQSEDGGTYRLRRTPTGVEGTYAREGQTLLTTTYAKAGKDVEFDAPDAPTEGPLPAMIGTWDVTGQWSAPGADGKPAAIKVSGASTFRWALGGAAMFHEYDRTTPMGPASALGLFRWPADVTSTKVWWFDTKQVEPMLADGPLEGDAWHGKGTMPDGGTMGLELAKKGDGFEMRYTMGDKPMGAETYARKK